MRQKYIDERWPVLMIHGKDILTGQPCVCDTNDNLDVVMRSPAEAEALVQHYAKLHAEFSAMAQAFDEAAPVQFLAWWYNR